MWVINAEFITIIFDSFFFRHSFVPRCHGKQVAQLSDTLRHTMRHAMSHLRIWCQSQSCMRKSRGVTSHLVFHSLLKIYQFPTTGCLW